MKSNKKRIIFVLAVLTMAILLSCALVACDKAGTDKTGTDIVADYKVTIHPNNGQSDIVWDITKEIPTITKDGFHIAGYFLDAQLTINTTLESLKATGITKNIDVYVKWEEHVEATDAAVEPTCTKNGLTEGTHCSVCNKILTAQTEIPALGHDLESHLGQPATCTEKGWEEYVTCKREGCDYTTYREIAVLGHTGGTATCTEQAICERCNEKYGNALGHKYGTLIPQTNATCSATGIRSHYKCSSCNKLFANDEHKTEITESDLIIPIDENAHDFGKWTRNDGTETHTRVCSFNSDHSETENCLGGTATCTEQAVCEKCNAKYGELAKHDYKDGVCTRCGDELASEGLEYSLNSDETGYTVTGIGTCTDTEIIIPSKHNSKPVTSIGRNAFRRCHDLTSIIVPDSVIKIEFCAFYGCTGLTNITLGNNVKSIDRSAFDCCWGLTNITIPNSVTSIGAFAFVSCKGLTNITIPDSVTNIGERAFANCSGLSSITVAKNNAKYHSAGNCLIETQSKSLILGCKNSIIPTDGSVASISEYAFDDCNGLTSIVIPDSVISIGNGAFSGCTGLAGVTIGNSVTSIGEGAFAGCTGLTSITIPDSVTSIGEGAFAGCTGLTSITVAKGNTKYHSAENCLIETESKTLIAGCKNSIIPADGSVTSIGDYAFVGCTGLTSITIPDSVTSIGENAFYNCSGLTSISIPNGVTSIGSSAFAYCTGLTSISIPDSVTSIGNYAFGGCTGLTSIYYTGDVAGWCRISGLDSLMSSSRTLYISDKKVEGELIIPDSVTSICDYAFYRCTELTSITIPDSVTSIGKYAFDGCTGLTSITIPDSVTSIGKDAFYNTAWYNNQPDGLVYAGNVAYTYKGSMPSNTSIVLKDGTLGIGDYAFSGCKGLTGITIPDSVTSIGSASFSSCSELVNITVADGNTKYHSSGNCLIETASKTLILGCNTSIIPNDGSVTSIGEGAFAGCTGLTSITIPDSVTSIGEGAFAGCTGLTSITVAKGNTKYHSAENCLIETESKTLIAGCKNSIIPADGSVTSIGGWAFSGCTGLTSITIPDSVTSIGDYAFVGCAGLTSVTIGNGVTSIGVQAFVGCTGLTSITFNGTIAQWNDISKGSFWKFVVPATEVVCTDGTVSI